MRKSNRQSFSYTGCLSYCIIFVCSFTKGGMHSYWRVFGWYRNASHMVWPQEASFVAEH